MCVSSHVYTRFKPTLALSLSTQLQKSIALKNISPWKKGWRDNLHTTAVGVRYSFKISPHWKQMVTVNCKLILNFNSSLLLLVLLWSNRKHWANNRVEKQFHSTCKVITAEYKIILLQMDYLRVLKHHPGYHQTATSCTVEEGLQILQILQPSSIWDNLSFLC